MHPIWYVAALSAFVTVSNSYSKGAPDTACADMTPDHHATEQMRTFPYAIKLSSNKIAPGGKVKVTIYGPNGDNFRGFFLQGRVGNKAVGHFDQAPETNLVNCHQGVKNAITHADNNDKASVVLTWNAPRALSEDAQFWATVVTNGSTFWVAKKSEFLSVGKP